MSQMMILELFHLRNLRMIRGVSRGLQRLELIAALMLLLAASVSAEEWYLPRATHLLKGGSWEVGARAQFLFERNGLDFDRRVDGVTSLRYAPTSRLELYAEGPYSYIEEERAVFPATISSTDQEGWGDLFTQVSYDFLGKEDWKLMLNLDAVIPTGKNPYEDARDLGGGFYSISPGLTYVRILDPAALFFYIGHQWTVPNSFPGIGQIEPGEDLRFRTGVSLMLHPRLRTSAYVVGDIVGHTRVRSIEIAGTDRDVIRFGGRIEWSVSDRVKLDVNSVFGATALSSDAVLSVGVTYSL
jgi:hypothetical protein